MTFRRTAILLLLPTLWLTSSHAAEADTKLTRELAKQDSIYRSEGEQTVQG